MKANDRDPIVAVATAAGRGAIGIVRMSFSEALDDVVLERLFEGGTKPVARRAGLLPIHDVDGALLDRGIVLYFPGPSSYTGETVLEFQVHGGPVLLRMVVDMVLRRCEDLGCRIARPGEFTERAFLNGRMDLAQAEAVTDLIDSASSAAARAAARSMSGEFSDKVSAIGEELDEVRAYTEAILDFPEEELDNLREGRVIERIAELYERVRAFMREARQGRLLRDGLTVALVGSPNVGKSSLLNALAGEDVAIVTDVAGTTRDKIEHWITIDDVPLRMVDTAGVRETDDIVEAKGIERTLQEVAKAEIVLRLLDAGRPAADDDDVLATVLAHARSDAHLMHVINKCDLADVRCQIEGLRVSAKTGEGLAELKRAILAAAGMTASPEGLFIARERHLDCLRRAEAHLEAALAVAAHGESLDLLAEELRLAGVAMGEILGQTQADDLLGMIFSKFCIGK